MQWTTKQAQEWSKKLPWIVGFNYLPRSAVNWNEMWQKESFNLTQIKEEFSWAAAANYNALRTNLPYIVWQNDRDGLIERIEQLLEAAAKNNLMVVLCLFDDCGFSGAEPMLGVQAAPINGLHNSQAVASPGRKVVMDKSQWGNLEVYVKDILNHFKHDKRILLWDLYNEPGNRMVFTLDGDRPVSAELEPFAQELMELTFKWAREIDLIQPLTVGGWHVPVLETAEYEEILVHPIDIKALELSDIISFHAYCQLDRMHEVVKIIQKYERPMLCTEWLARHVNSIFATHLPFFHKHNIGCFQWGLVEGKTQTIYPWPIVMKEDLNYSRMPFHDVLKSSGEAFFPEEIELIKQLKQTPHAN